MTLTKQVVIPGGSDATFFSKLVSGHRENRLLSVPAGSKLHFCIDHYAGVVTCDGSVGAVVRLRAWCLSSRGRSCSGRVASSTHTERGASSFPCSLSRLAGTTAPASSRRTATSCSTIRRRRCSRRPTRSCHSSSRRWTPRPRRRHTPAVVVVAGPAARVARQEVVLDRASHALPLAATLRERQGPPHAAAAAPFQATPTANPHTHTLPLPLLPRPRSSQTHAGTLKRGSTTMSAKTIASRFGKQLASLMKTLDETRPQFVRCIKPNAQKKPYAPHGQSAALASVAPRHSWPPEAHEAAPSSEGVRRLHRKARGVSPHTPHCVLPSMRLLPRKA